MISSFVYVYVEFGLEVINLFVYTLSIRVTHSLKCAILNA
jgi:hypothetical protein